jgi:uncharacterized damage-inducible protein DinB
MQTEMAMLSEQLKDSYEGEPWFGRPAKQLLGEVDETIAFTKLNDQHSILELVWHMCNWREFAISHLAPSDKTLTYFEENDWRELDHTNKALWQEGLQKLQQSQDELLRLLAQKDDALLEQNVSGRTYNYRKLISGIIQHDIYHLGQIAFITKALKSR